MNIHWGKTHAAIWRGRKASLREVEHIDPVNLDDLLGVETQKQQLISNTEKFLRGERANHALLWGARGTGKSSLIKAVFNAYREQGLRLIQFDKEDLSELPEVVDQLRELPQRFIIYCDDLSFEEGEHQYKALKTVMEGSIELPPENILLYATSNRRHLVPENMQDNLNSGVVNGELHYADAIEEKISLSDRFGLWLSFYSGNLDHYLSIVDHLFTDYAGDRAQLHAAAKLFAATRGAHTGRTAHQFYLAWKKQ